MNMTFGFSMNFAASGSGNIIQQAMGMAGGMGSSMPMGSSAMGMGGIFGSDQVGFSPEAMMGGGSNFFHPLMESGMGMGAPMMGFGNGMGMVPGMMSPGMMGVMQNPMMLMQMMMLLKMLMGTMQQQGMGMGMGMPGMGMGGFGSPVGMEGCGGGFAPSGGCPGFGGGGIGMCPGFDFGNGGHAPIHHGGHHGGGDVNTLPPAISGGGFTGKGNMHQGFNQLKGMTGINTGHQAEGLAELKKNNNGSLLYARTDFDICTDGSGPSHGDKYHLNSTSMNYSNGKPLNADKTNYVVLNPAVAKKYGMKLGDMCLLKHGDKMAPAIYGENSGSGNTKLGEGSYRLAKELGVNPDPNNGGTKQKDIEMIMFPGSGKGQKWNENNTNSEALMPKVQELMKNHGANPGKAGGAEGVQAAGGKTDVNGPANGVARFDNIQDRAGARDMATGKMTINGHTYQFRSGGHGRGYLPEGQYKVSNGRRRTSSGMYVNSSNGGKYGYSFDLSDKYDSRVGDTRSLLRIHPDGGSEGTMGCIGIVGDEKIQRQFYADMQAEIARNGGSYNLQVGR